MSKSTTGRKMLADLEKRVAELEREVAALKLKANQIQPVPSIEDQKRINA